MVWSKCAYLLSVHSKYFKTETSIYFILTSHYIPSDNLTELLKFSKMFKYLSMYFFFSKKSHAGRLVWKLILCLLPENYTKNVELTEARNCLFFIILPMPYVMLYTYKCFKYL